MIRIPHRSLGRFLIIGWFGLLCAGCAGLFQSETLMSEVDPYFLLQKVREHAARLKSFQGQAVWTAISEDGAAQGTTRVVLKTPDSLWLKVEGPFGIDVAFASVTSGKLLLFSPLLNAAFSGEAESPGADKVLPFGRTFSKNLLGAAGLLVPNDSLLEGLTAFYTEKNEYVLDFHGGDYIRILKKGPVVSRWEKRDSTGGIVWSWDAEHFKSRGNIRIPQTIRISTEKRQRLIVVYETAKTNSILHKGWCNVPIPEGLEAKKL